MRGILLSGGMDSTILAYNLWKEGGNKDLLAFHAMMTHSTAKEQWAAEKTAIDLGIELVRSKIMQTEKHEDIIPARNMLLVAWASNILHSRGGGELYIGFCKEDRYGFADCDSEFVELCNAMLAHSGCDITVHAPYVNMTKREIMQKSGADYAELVSYSCYRPDGPCGVCSACVLRAQSLEGRK